MNKINPTKRNRRHGRDKSGADSARLAGEMAEPRRSGIDSGNPESMSNFQGTHLDDGTILQGILSILYSKAQNGSTGRNCWRQPDPRRDEHLKFKMRSIGRMANATFHQFNQRR